MRNLGIDLLRLGAVLLVIGRHQYLPSDAGILRAAWHTGGWVGVDLFFVLSGFLVSGLLFREYLKRGSLNVGRFLVRRGLKIYPAFYAMILLSFMVLRPLDGTESAASWLSEIFFLQSYVPGIWTHTWSLAVELHFYVGLALFALVQMTVSPDRKNPFATVPLLFGLAAVSCLVFRALILNGSDRFTFEALLFPTHLRLDSLLFGVFLSYHWHFGNLREASLRIRGLVLLLGGILLLTPAFLCPLRSCPEISVYGVVLFYLGAGMLVLLAVRLQGSSNRLLRLGGNLGAASYSIYLWHMPVLDWTRELALQWVGVVNLYVSHFWFYLVGSILLGLAMHWIVERPILRWRDRNARGNPSRFDGHQDGRSGAPALA